MSYMHINKCSNVLKENINVKILMSIFYLNPNKKELHICLFIYF